MRADPEVGVGQPTLTEAVVKVRLRDGRQFERRVRGARGYPANPPTATALNQKFLSCARRAVSSERADQALAWLRDVDHRPVAGLTELLAQPAPVPVTSPRVRL